MIFVSSIVKTSFGNKTSGLTKHTLSKHPRAFRSARRCALWRSSWEDLHGCNRCWDGSLQLLCLPWCSQCRPYHHRSLHQCPLHCLRCRWICTRAPKVENKSFSFSSVYSKLFGTTGEPPVILASSIVKTSFGNETPGLTKPTLSKHPHALPSAR